MAPHDQGGQDSKGTPPRPAGETPSETGGGATRQYVLVACPWCGADISRSCLGGVFETPGEPVVLVLHHLRCPECNHPLLAMPDKRRIITPGQWQA